MSDFQPTSEAVEAVARRIFAQNTSPAFEWETIQDPGRDLWRLNARAAIAAFVEAEGLEIETSQIGTTTDGAMVKEIRLVGPWRKRD